MVLMPVAAREVREASRQPRTYAWRAATASAALTVLALFAWFNRYSMRQGQTLFVAVSTIAYLYCLIAGAVRTADTIAEEKRENTLGLLFLTDLKGWDIILGKLLSSSVNCLFGLLALIPMLAIPMLMGGVQWIEFVRVILALLVTLLLSISWGFLISSLFRASVVTISSALAIMIILGAGIPLVSIVLDEKFHARALSIFVFVFSPTHMHVFAFDTNKPGNFAHYWESLAINFALAAINLRLAIFFLPRFWQEVPKNKNTERWRERLRALRFGKPKAKKRLRARLLHQNPFFWLANREQVSSAGLMISCVVILLAGFTGGLASASSAGRGITEIMVGWFMALLVVHLVVAFRMAMAASYRLAEDRRSGALELLLGTEVSIRELLRGYWMALGRQFFGPAMITLFSGGLAVLMMLLEFSDTVRMQGNVWATSVEIVRRVFTHGADKEAGLVFFMVLSIKLILVLNWIALIWMGMWMGLREKRPGVATWATLSAVLLPPWILLIVGSIIVAEMGLVRGMQPDEAMTTVLISGWILAGANIISLSLWSRRNLLNRFREAAADRFVAARRISWPKVRRVVFRFAAAGASVILLFCAVRHTIDLRGNAAWAKALAAHPNFKLDFPPEPARVPDEQNLAKSEIILSLTAAGGNRNRISWDVGPAFGSGEMLNWDWPQRRHMNLPHIEDVYIDRKVVKDRSESPSRTVLDGLAKYDADLAELHADANERPSLQFPANIPQQPFYALPYNPYYTAVIPDIKTPIRQLIQTLALRASAGIEEGRTNTADIFLALRLARGVGDLPQSFLSYNEMTLDCVQPIYDGLTRRAWRNDELKRIQDYFAAQDFWTGFDRCRSEYLRQSMREVEGVISARRGAGPSRQNWLSRQAPIGTLRRWEADMLNWCADTLPKIVDTAGRRIDAAALHNMPATRPQPPTPRVYPDQIIVAIRSLGFLQTTADQIVVACALERFRNDHQKLPTRLDELVPDYLAAVPRDVFTNAPLKFVLKSEGQNYTIYSVGLDGQDDNGIAGSYAGSWMFWQDQAGTDWVWNSSAIEPQQKTAPRKSKTPYE